MCESASRERSKHRYSKWGKRRIVFEWLHYLIFDLIRWDNYNHIITMMLSSCHDISLNNDCHCHCCCHCHYMQRIYVYFILSCLLLSCLVLSCLELTSITIVIIGMTRWNIHRSVAYNDNDNDNNNVNDNRYSKNSHGIKIIS